ncbi:MAG: FAD-binding protein [Cryobacterium sp.]|nr:FAD-binding protein [Cryobacterium sp.]
MVVSVTISQPPEGGDEVPVGAHVLTKGAATGVGGAEPHPIDSVTVKLNDGALVDAHLTPSSPPSPTVSWAATVQLVEPGEQRITVTARDDIGRTAPPATVTVATVGTTFCKPGVLWLNYPRTQSITPHSTCRPQSLAGLVATVRHAEETGQRARPSGSRWSFSDCAVSGGTSIDTRSLDRPLQRVQHALRPGAPSTVFHVESGITIQSLARRLDHLGLALETMGGAAGQTLAGAVSTGTHGGDKTLPPIADSILAFHTVGVGGIQHWVEPTLGITDPGLLRQHVAPGVAHENITYSDDLFNAWLVSLGALGVAYSMVVRVRPQYDLIETTRRMTWRDFQATYKTQLDDPDTRFLQVIVGPYRDAGEHPCLVTTRAEASPSAPLERPSSLSLPTILAIAADIGFGPDLIHILTTMASVDFGGYPDEMVTRIAEAVLTDLPAQLPILKRRYIDVLSTVWPEGPVRGLSHSVMDLGYDKPQRPSQPGNSVEMFFPATGAGDRLGCASFVDETLSTTASATDTFFAGYISIRFTRGSRAFLGMQRWPSTCSVEVSAARGVRGMPELIQRLYQTGIRSGGLTHWGQQLDHGITGYGGTYYPDYHRWRDAYGGVTNQFTQNTFASQLSDRWNLTNPDDATEVSTVVAPAEVFQGRAARVTVVMRNSGVSTWTPAAGVALVPDASADAAPWQLSPQTVAQDVPPGSTATFTIESAAPTQVGVYRLAWRMSRGSSRSFGSRTTRLVVRVVPLALVTVPDLIDLSGVAAGRLLKQVGLVPHFTGATTPPNHVGGPNAQNPPAGASVQAGATIEVHLLAGPAP